MVCRCNRWLSVIWALLFTVFWLIATYYIKQWLWSPLPNQHYFQKDLQRRNLILTKLRSISTPVRQPENPDFIVAVITAERSYGKIDFDYPEQVIGEFLRMQKRRKDFGVFLCVASKPRSSEPLTYLEQPFEERYRIRLTNPESIFIKQKELKDYMSCLDAIQMRFPGVKNIVLNEDDGLPLHGFPENINLIIKQLEVLRHLDRNNRRNRISHVKLHHPTSLRKIPYLIFAIVVPLSMLSLMKWFLITLKKDYVSNFYLLVISMFIFSAVYFAGPTKIGELHRKMTLSHFPLVFPESCCTVSVLFPRETLNATLKYLKTSSIELPLAPKDSLLDALPSSTGMSVYMTEYNLVRHIGMFSSIRRNSKQLVADVERFAVKQERNATKI